MARSVVPLALVVGLLLAGCQADPAPTPAASGTPEPPSPEATTPSASASEPPPDPSVAPTDAAPSAARPLADASATWETVGEGFEGPVQVLVDPRDGHPLVVEQTGRVSRLDGSGTVLDLTDRVTAGGERGLLGAAFHPSGDRLYVHYSGDGGQTVLSSFPVADDQVDAGSEAVGLTQDQPAGNHNGGDLQFDRDGSLLLGLGDGGGAGDQFGNGQDPGSVLGTILRLQATATGEVTVTSDNPFVDGGGDARVWVYGLRNPWRFDLDDRWLYVADVGQDAVEEVSVVPRGQVAGSNFGWPVVEGTRCFRESDCDPSGTVTPVAELFHDEGACSIIGGVVVPVDHPTGLGGAFIFSDLCDTRLRAVRAGEDGTESGVIAGGELPSSPLGFGSGPDGQVWVGLQDGQVLQLAAG